MIFKKRLWISIGLTGIVLSTGIFIYFQKWKKIQHVLSDPRLEKKAAEEESKKNHENAKSPAQKPTDFSRIVDFKSLSQKPGTNGFQIRANASFAAFIEYIKSQGNFIYRLGILRPILTAENVPGLRISYLPAGGLFAKLGAKKEDIITHINGISVNNRIQMAKQWLFLQSDKQVKIDIQRGEKQITFLFRNSDVFD